MSAGTTPSRPGLPVIEDRPSGSVHAEAEGVTCRVEEDPAGCAGLMRVFGCAELEHGRLGGIEVVDNHIEVHLLGRFLACTVPLTSVRTE